MNSKFEKTKAILLEHNQEHVLNSYSNLSEENKEKLLEQIFSIDFKLIDDLYATTKIKFDLGEDIIEPISYVEKAKLSKKEEAEYLKIGEDILNRNQLAVVTMAGGQGTRLGHNGPKGTYDLGIEGKNSIFQILTDILIKSNNKYNISIPWYIMTSEENNYDTSSFFEKNNYFGYNKNNIKFFNQGKLPMLMEDGKLLINEQGLIKEAADGHGGIFEALYSNGIVEDMNKRNIKWAFIGPVDNVLVNMVDPIFIGLSQNENALGAGKSAVKAYPSEKVGVFCTRNKKPNVIEYTELPAEMGELKTNDGELLYAESHLNCNMFHIDILEKLSGRKLPYHPAHKKSSYMDENGKIVVSDKPNSYKFESFIFDAFGKLEKMAILRVKREEEFAPVKNAEGSDSPKTAIELYNNFHKTN